MKVYLSALLIGGAVLLVGQTQAQETNLKPANGQQTDNIGDASANRNRRQIPGQPFYNERNRDQSRSISPRAAGLFSVNSEFSRQWWEGPHVCMTKNEEEVEGVNPETLLFAIHSKQCSETPTTRTCITKVRKEDESKNIIEKFTCCHGFTRRPDGPGCVEADLKDLTDTLSIIGTTKFSKIVDDSRVDKRSGNSEMNITVFAPTNLAIEDFESEKGKDLPTKEEQASAHMVEGYYHLADLQDEQVLNTLDGKSSIRFNEFYNPHKVLTANCVPIVAADNFHKQGVVHVVDGTLPSPTMTVLGILQSNEKYSTFNELLMSNEELVGKLEDTSAHYTVFAPTNDAFEIVDKETLEMWKKGEGCVSQLIMGHIVPHTICSTAIPVQARVRNLLKAPIMLQRNGNRVTAEGVGLVDRDQVATNGVVHSLENIMASQTAKSLIDTLKQNKMTDLVHLIESNGLAETLNHNPNFTFFAPTEEAIKDVSLKEWETLKTEDKIKTLFEYHVTDGKVVLKSLFNNMIVPSTVPESKIRVNVYAKNNNFNDATYTAQCARIVSQPIEVCGGSVYFVDKVLKQPEQSIFDVIKDSKDHKIFTKLITKAKLETQFRDNAGPFTVLAPTDEAFKKLTSEEMEALEKGDGVEQLARTHIIPEMLCSGGINHNNAFAVQEYTNLDGKAVSAQRSIRGHVYFGGARTEMRDITANNGVVHIIDRVLNSQPEAKPQPVAPASSNQQTYYTLPRL